MENLLPPSDFYINNRVSFIKLLKPSSIALISPHDTLPRSADQFFPYKPNPNLLYLTGVTQPESILFLFPDSPNPAYKEILFISDRNEALEIWYGKRMSKDEAAKLSGIKNVQWLSNFDAITKDAMLMAENVYLDYNEYGSYSGLKEYKNLRFAEHIKNNFPLHNYQRTYPLLAKLRLLKQKDEINIIKKAIDITNTTFEKLTQNLKPALYEYELEALITYNFIKNNARSHGFSPIVASGLNACYLHYNENNSLCNKDDLCLIDIGAEYLNYTSDITRVLPVSGKYSERQKTIYNSVLKILKEAQKLLIKGNTINNVNTDVAKIMEEELIHLGLLKFNDVKKQNLDNPLYKKYFPHGTSHFLGMDAHDVGNKFIPFEPGMILTCEPGIYIFEEKLGIRLENDVLITDNKPIILSEQIPIEINHIESLMNNNTK